MLRIAIGVFLCMIGWAGPGWCGDVECLWRALPPSTRAQFVVQPNRTDIKAGVTGPEMKRAAAVCNVSETASREAALAVSHFGAEKAFARALSQKGYPEHRLESLWRGLKPEHKVELVASLEGKRNPRTTNLPRKLTELLLRTYPAGATPVKLDRITGRQLIAYLAFRAGREAHARRF